MDARAEYVIRIPAAALHPRRRSRTGAKPAPVAQALRDLLTVLSSEPPVLRPGKFTLRIRAGGVYYRFGIEVPCLRDAPEAAPSALSGDAAPGTSADADDTAGRRAERGGWGGMRRRADGLWEITPYSPDVAGW